MVLLSCGCSPTLLLSKSTSTSALTPTSHVVQPCCFGYHIPINFNIAIRGSQHLGFLAPLAHLIIYLVAGLFVHPDGWAHVSANWKVNRNILITFALGGLWHGASWSFVIWGIFHGTLSGCTSRVRRPQGALA